MLLAGCAAEPRRAEVQAAVILRLRHENERLRARVKALEECAKRLREGEEK